MGKGRGKGRTKRTKNLKTTVDHGTYIHDISTPQTQKTEEIQILIHFFLCVCLPSLAATTTLLLLLLLRVYTHTCVHVVCKCTYSNESLITCSTGYHYRLQTAVHRLVECVCVCVVSVSIASLSCMISWVSGLLVSSPPPPPPTATHPTNTSPLFPNPNSFVASCGRKSPLANIRWSVFLS